MEVLFKNPAGHVLHRGGCARVNADRARPCCIATEDARLCASCFPRCVVCMAAPGYPLRGCPAEHAVCGECMIRHAEMHLRETPELPLRCPCGKGDPLRPHADLSGRCAALMVDGTREALLQLTRERRQCREAIARREGLSLLGDGPGFRRFAVELCDHARARECPHCARRFLDFDGCAAVRCTCKLYFCALCLQGFDDEREAHQHVALECALNPHASYWVPLEVCHRAWLDRARRRARAALRALRADGGTLLAFVAWVFVRMRDAELLPLLPGWRWPHSPELIARAGRALHASMRTAASGALVALLYLGTVGLLMTMLPDPPSQEATTAVSHWLNRADAT